MDGIEEAIVPALFSLLSPGTLTLTGVRLSCSVESTPVVQLGCGAQSSRSTGKQTNFKFQRKIASTC